ncbi:hypothetical protein QF026_008243 [Streptomyces aurantiacus]|uniref:hypothetical protein n=1 Tax=Streptomyces aurantiacus TaxID=47760 RepID=UPI0027903FA9|nr:hypothetical protein [Streptomyces aurantiacus]MDQ0779777.1 hypothetical protein [Streptomyces aurantiacus]
MNSIRKAAEISAKVLDTVNNYVFHLYFPANNLSLVERVRCVPPILLAEFLVYRLDSAVEQVQGIDLQDERGGGYGEFRTHIAKLESVLRWLHAYNKEVARQLEAGEQYVRLENRVTSSRVADHADVLRLAELRSTDVRLLHNMIFALLRRPCDEDLLDLMWPVEVLADIGSDFSHYSDDVAAARYNTYAMLVKLYGDAAPDLVRAEITRYEQQFLAVLERFPEERRAGLKSLCLRRYKQATADIPRPLPQIDY